jgi:LuxR family transcriptional regulator, maltose regulon positive regulatory protein
MALSAPLLTTKLFIPPAPAERVLRPHLLEKLDKGLKRSLVLISAPAGFGKTTLLSQWVRQRQLPAAWISLDDSDNDLSRMLAYLVSALNSIDPDQSGISIEEVQSIQPGSIEPILTRLINQMASITRPFVLILDDYHLIVDEAVHEVIHFILDYCPPNLHMVIASRVDPPFLTARLRGRGQLLELRSADLRFSTAEASDFLNKTLSINLPEKDVKALTQHTEGWITGLQMAAVSMQGRPDASSFVQAFTGSHRYILDYLMEEVLQRQSRDMQEFLLKTSILSQLSAPLCEAVTGQKNCQPILESMERTNLFLTPLDDERQWYRYHHLFAKLLHKQLDQVYPDQIKNLHLLASQWYSSQAAQQANHTLASTAIEHALQAEAFDQAVELITHTGETTLMRGETTIIKGWLRLLPEDVFNHHPELYAYEAIQMLLSGNSINEIEKILQQAEVAATRSKSFQAKLDALHGLIAVLQGRFEEGLQYIQKAQPELSKEHRFWRNLVDRTLAMEQFMRGDVDASLEMLNNMITADQSNLENLYYLPQMADLYSIQGRLIESWEIYSRALEAATESSGNLLPVAGIAQIGMGEVLREWNRLDEAEETVLKGVKLVYQWGEIGAMDGYINLMRIRQSRRDFNGAANALADAIRLARRFDATDMDDFLVANYQARLETASGDVAAAWERVRDNKLHRFLNEDTIYRGRDAASAFYFLFDTEQITLARIHIARHQGANALAVLEPLFEKTRRSAWKRSAIENLILQAIAYAQIGETEPALDALQEALQAAEPHGFVRLFLDEGPPILNLLKSHTWQPQTLHDYARRLLDAADNRSIPTQDINAPHAPAAETLPEPLSERELEVLQLIANGLTNRQIAENLVIAPSTVKTHINNIYSKLNASRRTQAVAQARNLGLVE